MRFLNKFIAVLGIFLMILFAGGVVFWESVGRNIYQYQEAIVLSSPVKKGEVISRNNIKTIKVDKSLVIANSITDPYLLVDKVANNFIPANCQISPEFIVDKELVLNKDQFIFKVPVDWIKAIPSSIRRRDNVVFFEVIDTEKTDSSKIIINSEPNTESYPTYNTSEDKVPIDPSTPLLNTVVAFVKDNANREVVTVGEIDRYNGSSQVSDLEIIVTAEQVDLLKKSIEKGYKFLVMYNEL